MSGSTMFGTPRRNRRGLTLTLVFGAVLATGAATGSFGGGPGAPAPAGPPTVDRPAPAAGASGGRSGAGASGSGAGGSGGTSGPGAGTSGSGTGVVGTGAGSSGADTFGTADIASAIDGGRIAPSAVSRLVTRDGGPWSAFYTPQQFEGFHQELDGGYVGVGLWVRRAPDGTISVSQVQPGTPARRAGVAAGDVLRAVDGTPVSGRPVTDVVARLRGVNPADPADPATAPAPDPGSAVRLVVVHHGHPRTVVLRRALLSARPVTVTRPAPGVESIAVSAFTAGVGGQVRAALAGGDHRDGVLLDLRGDSGGLVTEAVDVASLFLRGGEVASYDVDGTPHRLDARPGGDTATPLVVLVDGGTMSAAELLTGALQDRGRAVVVGSRTFGKGSVQLPSALPDGSVAELTVGHYRTPDGHVVDGHGIRPDVLIAPGRPGSVAERTAITVLSGLGTAP
ncbi:S41 family peptidase [Streptomyces sp. SL13]|uniref:S41 family peptidase n=1 Tax=Streptantibioticus silvisoli TaxID=2705255 RepID=A0AA90H8N6_9ACTN|nr:S41 family peptidase [Streptantibioticus silvisoli]MDI5972544.1 S41 family peptidase [Streptantibioticus silvisoli]